MKGFQKMMFESRKKSSKKTRKCMYSDCDRNSIKSHVFQKNGNYIFEIID